MALIWLVMAEAEAMWAWMDFTLGYMLLGVLCACTCAAALMAARAKIRGWRGAR